MRGPPDRRECKPQDATRASNPPPIPNREKAESEAVAEAPSIAFVFGTRPEIIKLSPLIRACEASGIEFTLVHTGQHYSDGLSDVFFRDLKLPTPAYDLTVGSGSHGAQTGRMILRIERVLQRVQPDVVLVQGDTNSVLAGSIAADKLPTTLGHVEAGLRSFDREMPEESNRRIADHLADQLYAPTQTAWNQLTAENIPPSRIHMTGNTVVDAVTQNRDLARQRSTIHTDLEVEDQRFGLLTAHRAENVDDPESFAALLAGVGRAAKALQLRVIYPIHPRSKARLETLTEPVPDPIELVEPLDYFDFLRLESDAEIIFTDSGGIQEEACILQVPCVTLRERTERPETVSVGANRLVGTNPDRIVAGATEMIDTVGSWDNPFGDGTAAIRILETITEEPVSTDWAPIPASRGGSSE